MLKIGCHLSASNGYYAMGEAAKNINANTFAFFTRNPRGGSAKAINEADVAKFTEFANENGISRLVAHSPYTLNPCSSNEHLRDFARETMADDLNRLEYTPGNYYNFHPGAHTGQGSDVGIRECADMLNAILDNSLSTTVLIETMSGKGSEIGKTFEEIAEIISLVNLKNKIGVCLDTCHIWDGGYDIVNDLDGVLANFDKIIGLDKLKAVHLNDSLNPCGAHQDRHAKIGEGYIGKDALVRVINHEALYTLPFILETPNDEDGYRKEIALLRSEYRH